jgi:hypothetical protein
MNLGFSLQPRLRQLIKCRACDGFTTEPFQEPSLSLFPESPDAGISLAEARKKTLAAAEQGIECPCCGQFVKLYRRKFNCAMARVLLSIYRWTEKKLAETSDFGAEWLHVPGHLLKHKLPRSDEAKMTLWGLLESMQGERQDGSRRNGYYRITDLGKRFARNEVRLPKYVWIYNQRPFGFSDGKVRPNETISIIEALGESFDYRELMSGE